jgi:hypothetical protein
VPRIARRSLGLTGLRGIAGVLAIGLVTSGCRTPGAAASGLADAPSLEDTTGEAKCGVRKSTAKPLIVEWPAAERAALEARAARGIVAVRYEGCDMEILTTCSGTGTYEYVGLTQKREGVRITNADELYAQLPVGAVGLEAKLARAGQLNVDMAIVGRREATQHAFTERDLQGRCAEATHVITGLTVGAFSFYTGASAEVGGAVKIGNAGVGAGSSADREILKSDGDQDACALASSADVQPPEGCAALLRVEVVPVDRIWGTSRNVADTTGAGFVSNSPPPPSPQDVELDRKIDRAKGMQKIGFYGLFGVAAVIAGAALYYQARLRLKREVGMDAVSSNRQGTINSAYAGIGLMAAGGAIVVAGLTLALVGGRRAQDLQAKKNMRASVRPTIGPGGFGLTGRF